MAEANVEIIRDVYERWRAGDFRAGDDVFDPLVLFVMRPEFPDVGTYLGRDRLGEYTRGFLEPWSRITIEAEELISAGDSVVVPVWQRGVGEESGAATELRSSDTSTCGRSGAKG
jgi:ketosteroid isomerase-like protein